MKKTAWTAPLPSQDASPCPSPSPSPYPYPLLLLSLLLSLLLPPAAALAQSPVPAPVPAEPHRLTADEANAIATRVFGLVVRSASVDPDVVTFSADGFQDRRTCPLDGVRDVQCGDFAWTPERVIVHRPAWIGGVSGHLARNLVVLVELESDSAGLANGVLHGVLVFPTPEIGARGKPAFAWYLSRLGQATRLDLHDVDGDGVLDLIYTYAQQLPFGEGVVPRDVWTVVDLAPDKLLSSGEKLSGVFVSTFDGLPLHRDGEGRADRGAWRMIRIGPGLSPFLLTEVARFSGASTSWEIHLVGDLGDGWREYLAGSSEVSAGEDAMLADCTPDEPPSGQPIETRRLLLEIEEQCRSSREASRPVPSPAARVVRALYASFFARLRGLPLVAAALEERAANDLVAAGPRGRIVACLLALDAARAGQQAFLDAWDPAIARAPGGILDALAPFPALAPVVATAGRVLSAARRIPAMLSRSGDRFD